MMENNDEEVKGVLNQIKKDDEINSKSGKKPFFNSKKIKLIIILIILVVIFIFVQRKVLKRYYYYSVGNDDMTILEDKEYKLIKSYKEYSEYVKWLQNGYKQEALEKYKWNIRIMRGTMESKF